ncbi:MAG: dapF [Chlorobi bacterium]|nr:dapF [Chlorobiota bacterium]
MITLDYTKMSGAGNTFIVFDGRELPADISLDAISPLVCDAALSHGGADGMIAIYPWNGGDFEMKYYNRDGSTGMMCGNGGRCAVRFAVDHGFARDASSITFINAGERYRASLTERGVRISFPDPKLFRATFPLDLFGTPRPCNFADVGTPHAVLFMDEMGEDSGGGAFDIDRWGAAVRRHQEFAPEGANANFVEMASDGSGIRLRTFERGVEAETGACGTGAVSSAIIASQLRGLVPPVAVITTSGATLYVDFQVEDGHVTDVSLEGGAEGVGKGELVLDEDPAV